MMHAYRAQNFAETVALQGARSVERILFLITKGDAIVLKATIKMGNNAPSAQMLYALHVQATAATSVQRMQRRLQRDVSAYLASTRMGVDVFHA